MEREVIRPNNPLSGPSPLPPESRVTPPLSPAIRYGDFVFVSGQGGTDPQTGRPAEGIEAQTRQVLENLKTVLEAAGSSLGQVLKTTCFLASMDDFGAFNSVYRQYFPQNPPARSTFQVGGLVTGFVVEIEAIAVVDRA